MSYEIIKSIAINHKTKEVYITGNSNNVYPRTPRRWHCEYLTTMYKAEGLEAVEKYILGQYLGGMMQGGDNDYNKSVKVFGTPQQPDQSLNYGNDIEQAYLNLLKYRADKKEKCVIRNGNNFISRLTARRAFMTDDINRAKTFAAPDALIILKRFSGHGLTTQAI